MQRRAPGQLELRVNGVFVMDNLETSSERELARHSLGRVEAKDLTVLIGGLGLGFTLLEVLSDARVRALTVVEIEPSLVAWHRGGAIDTLRDGARHVFDDPRVDVVVEDIGAFVQGVEPESYDAVLLDVDNGPGYLVYDSNARIYGHDFLSRCARITSPHGVVAVWSASAAPDLLSTMEAVFARVDEQAIEVRLGRRDETYHLYLGHR